MLLALGLPLPKVVCSHGFILADGQKMSKSIGNVVDPIEVLEKHGTDAFRYYFLRHVDTFADGDFTWDKFESAYNTELANDYGNLVQRLATMAMKNNIGGKGIEPKELDEEYCDLLDNFELSKAFDYVWEKVQNINKRIDDEKPWMLAKSGETEKLRQVMTSLIEDLKTTSLMLSPFLPDATSKVVEIFAGETITPLSVPLFPKD